MRHPLSFYAIPAAALLLLPGCIDDNYDLDNIDTETELKVKDLVVPINFSALTLDDVTDLSDNEFITLVKGNDGKEYYAFSRTESFESAPVTIPSFTISAPYFPSVRVPLEKAYAQSPQKRAVALNQVTALKELSFSGNLPEGVVEIDHLEVETTQIGIDLYPYSSSLSCSDLRLQFPAGLDVTSTTMGTYDKATGVLTVGATTLKYGHNRFDLVFNGIGKESLKSENGKYELASKVGILSTGNLTYNGDLSYTSPYLDITYDLYNIYPTVITASVDYNINYIKFNPVTLSGLPDFLAGSSTSLNAADPQIYVGIDNNVGDFSGDTYLGFTSFFRNKEGTDFKTEGISPQKIAVSKDKRTNIFLAARAEAVPSLAQYLNPTPTDYQFPDLTKVLYAGQPDWGLPKEIYINATDVAVRGTHVDNLPLGSYDPGFTGTYTVFVPLAFEKGSIVQYTTTDSNWDTEDLSDLRVNKMSLTAVASSDIPFALDFSIVPLDKAGKPIPVAKSTHIELPAGANMKEIKLEIEAIPGQPIQGLNGISYTALVKVNEEGEYMPLTPDMKISLSNVRLTIDGAWTHKF